MILFASIAGSTVYAFSSLPLDLIYLDVQQMTENPTERREVRKVIEKKNGGERK